MDLIEPAFACIADEVAPYRGVLFCETMVTPKGPWLASVIRNARF